MRDRFGHVPEPEGPDHPLFAQIRRLIDSGMPGLSSAGPATQARWGYLATPIRAPWRAPISAPRRSGWCGAPTGRIRARTRGWTTRQCSTRRVGARSCDAQPYSGQKPRSLVRVSRKHLNASLPARCRGLTATTRIGAGITPTRPASSLLNSAQSVSITSAFPPAASVRRRGPPCHPATRCRSPPRSKRPAALWYRRSA
jgi:hypothetical protein